METIFALSTAPGKAGIAVIRLSGPAVAAAAVALCGALPGPRQASLRVLRDGEGARLDEAVILYFPEGASFTGEPVLELQTHGSPAVISALLRLLSTLPGLRPADPGEFTRRALANGRLDLTQVEALADLLESETEAQRRQAMRVFSGSLGEKCVEWRMSLLRALTLLEVTIDFADEEVPVDVFPEVRALLTSAKSGLDTEIAGFVVAERIRSGFEVAILGAPNAGKSTLLNILGGLDHATSGRVWFRDLELTSLNDRRLTLYRRDHVGFVFQFYNLVASLTARENVQLVTDVAPNPMPAAEALAQVGLEHRLDHFPAEMSGGEQQRVAIARAIAKRPEVLLCDEPTGALDSKTGVQVLEVLRDVNDRLGTSTAVITHNAAIRKMAHRVVYFLDGRIDRIEENATRIAPSQIKW